jgi:hypothetical protein
VNPGFFGVGHGECREFFIGRQAHLLKLTGAFF